MAFNITATLNAVLSYLDACGYFGDTTIGEYKQPPGTRLSAAIFMSSTSFSPETLTRGIEVHGTTIRVYLDMLDDPPAKIETDMSIVVSKVITDLMGDWTLGSAVFAIDDGNGASLATSWGYLDVGGTMYRIADITLPLLVDAAVTMAP